MKKSLLYTLCLICMAGASGCGDADYWAIYGEGSDSETCTPKCEDQTCGDDGCGGECKCGDGLICNEESGECEPEVCNPECKEGCTCKDGACVDGDGNACVDEPKPEVCEPACKEGCTCKNGACVDGSGNACGDEPEPEVCEPTCKDGCTCKAGVCIDGSGNTCVDEPKPEVCDPACKEGCTCQDGACVDGDGNACEQVLEASECPENAISIKSKYIEIGNQSCTSESTEENTICIMYDNNFCEALSNYGKDGICVDANIEFKVDGNSFNQCNLNNVNIVGYSAENRPMITFEGGAIPNSLFGTITNGSNISNLEFDFNIESSVETPQGLLAASIDKSTLNNLLFKGNLNTSANTNVGGVVGEASKSTINNVHYSGNVTVIASGNNVSGVGGIVGVSEGTDDKKSEINDVTYKGEIKVEGLKVEMLGGIVGKATNTNIKDAVTEKESKLSIVSKASVQDVEKCKPDKIIDSIVDAAEDRISDAPTECSVVSICGGVAGSFNYGEMIKSELNTEEYHIKNQLSIDITANDNGIVNRIGGVIGGMYNVTTDKTLLQGVYNNGSITIKNKVNVEYIGGVIGKVALNERGEDNTEIKDFSKANQLEKVCNDEDGKISISDDASVRYIGGLFGELRRSVVDNVKNNCKDCSYGNLQTNTGFIGGILGKLTIGKLTNVTNKIKSVKGGFSVGGFAGAISDNHIIITDEKKDNYKNKVYLSDIENKVINVEGKKYTGGFIGVATGSHTIQNVENVIGFDIDGNVVDDGGVIQTEIEDKTDTKSETKQHLGGFVSYIYSLNDVQESHYENIKNYVTKVIAASKTDAAGGFVGHIEGVGTGDESNCSWCEYIGENPAGKGSMELYLKKIDSRATVDLVKVTTKNASYGGFIGYYHNQKFKLDINNVFSNGLLDNAKDSVVNNNGVGGYIGKVGDAGKPEIKYIVSVGGLRATDKRMRQRSAILGQNAEKFNEFTISDMYYYNFYNSEKGKDTRAFSNTDENSNILKFWYGSKENTNVKTEQINNSVNQDSSITQNVQWASEDICPIWEASGCTGDKKIWTPVVQITDWAAATTSN